MTQALAEWIVTALGVYLAIGLLVALAYAFGGAGKIDPAARGSGMPWSVRLLIMPGVMGLWPIMAYKLLAQTEPPIS